MYKLWFVFIFLSHFSLWRYIGILTVEMASTFIQKISNWMIVYGIRNVSQHMTCTNTHQFQSNVLSYFHLPYRIIYANIVHVLTGKCLFFPFFSILCVFRIIFIFDWTMISFSHINLFRLCTYFMKGKFIYDDMCTYSFLFVLFLWNFFFIIRYKELDELKKN